MKSHYINIHEPSHLSEHNSSVSLAVHPGGGERKGRKEGRWETGGIGMGEGVAVAAVLLPSPFVKIRHDAHWGLLFEPWTHPAKLHHLLQHTCTRQLPLNLQMSHISSQVRTAGSDPRGFSPPQCHCGHLVLSRLLCFYFRQTDECQGSTCQSTMYFGRNADRIHGMRFLHLTPTGGLSQTPPYHQHLHLQLSEPHHVHLCSIRLQCRPKKKKELLTAAAWQSSLPSWERAAFSVRRREFQVSHIGGTKSCFEAASPSAWIQTSFPSSSWAVRNRRANTWIITDSFMKMERSDEHR